MATILVNDDDITIQLTLKRILLKQGYEVDIASDGETGLEKALALQPDVIVCDWMMPGMKGPEVCQRVREYPELAATFFILLTAFDSVEDIVRGLDAGADDFLTKPPEIAELKARIRTGCRSFELTRALQLKTQELDVGLRATAEYLRSLLPPPCNTTAVSFSSEWRPSPQLGGSCIFGHWLNEDVFAFGLLETVQRGIDAALQIARLVTSIRSAQLEDTDYTQPDRVLAALDRQIQEQSADCERAFSIWYGTFRPSNTTLTYCSAGNVKAVVVNSRGRVTQLAGHRPTLRDVSTATAPPEEQQDSAPISCAEFKPVNRPLKSGNTLYLLNSGLAAVAQSSQDESEGIQWLLNAESQTKGDRILTIAMENLRTIRVDQFNDARSKGDTFDSDVALVRVRVH